MEILFSMLPLLVLGGVLITLMVQIHREDTLRMKLKFIQDLIEKGYETEQIDIDSLLNNKKIIEIKDKK